MGTWASEGFVSGRGQWWIFQGQTEKVWQMAKYHLNYSILRKQPFFAESFLEKCQVSKALGLGSHCPLSNAHGPVYGNTEGLPL